MNYFISNMVFVETEDDKNYINKNLNLFRLNASVSTGNNYVIHNSTPNSSNSSFGGTYIVKPLDTIEKVALKLGITKDDVIKLSGCNALYVGQKFNYTNYIK